MATNKKRLAEVFEQTSEDARAEIRKRIEAKLNELSESVICALTDDVHVAVYRDKIDRQYAGTHPVCDELPGMERWTIEIGTPYLSKS